MPRPVEILYESLKDSLPTTFRPTVAVHCPFCQEVGSDQIYVCGTEDGDGAVYHSGPACAEWHRHDDVSDFLRAAREKMGIPYIDPANKPN